MNRIFRDEYTDFTFNGVRSSQMKVWITNNKDLQFRLTPEFSDTFLAPSFSNTQILNNTNITKSTFSLKCIAIDVTMQDWRAIQGWLSPTAVGRLSFDFNVGTYYNAKIDKSISGTAFIKGGDRNLSDRYIIEFTVGFTTVGDYTALGEVNVGVLGKDFNTEYKIESVSNNRYFMPSIKKLNNGAITAKTLVKINNRTLSFKYSDTLLVDIIDFSVKTSENTYSPVYRVQGITEKVDEKEETLIQVSKIQYENGTQVANNQTKYKADSEDALDLNFFGEELFLFVISGNVSWTDSSVNQYAVCNVGSYDMHPSLLLNAQDFSIKKNNEEIYNYSMKIPVVVSVDGQNGFVLSQGQPIENVSYKMKQNETIYEYVLVDNWKNNGTLEIESGKPQIFKGRYNKSEIIKYYYSKKPQNEEGHFNLYVGERVKLVDNCERLNILKDNEKVQDTSNYFEQDSFIAFEPGEYIVQISTSSWTSWYAYDFECTITVKTRDDKDWLDDQDIGHIYTFFSPEPLQYDHRNRTAVHIFQNVSGTQPYNTSTYPLFISEGNENTYNIQFINSHFATECRIECVKENDYYKYSILVPGADSYNLTEGLTYYISICDYDVLDIQVSGSSQDSFIYLQTRDAF